jgi:hypothetical protein
MLSLGGLHAKHAIQRGIWVPTQHLLWDLDRVGRSQDLLNANWLLASSQALNMQVLTLVPICAVALLKRIYMLFLQMFHVHIFWICTKQCTTPAEGMHTYMHKYAYKHTYICICDFLITDKFESILKFGKIGSYSRFDAHPIKNCMFHSSIRLIFLGVATAGLDLHSCVLAVLTGILVRHSIQIGLHTSIHINPN